MPCFGLACALRHVALKASAVGRNLVERFALALCACGLACSSEPDLSEGPDAGSREAVELGAIPKPRSACTAPIAPVDVSRPASVVGHGPGTCTEQLFEDAVRQGGIVTFDCGGPATITLTHPIELTKDRDTVIDGGGAITLDGAGRTRLLRFDSGDFRKTHTTITLQRLTLANARSTGKRIPAAPEPCSQGFEIDGGGAAIHVTDGILHVIDCVFLNGRAAHFGPDVAGGAIYAIGSLDVTVTGSRFGGNSASNGGAIGSLQSNLVLVNNVFFSNQATGSGANTINDTCPRHPTPDGPRQIGSGGNGGAVSIDGGEEFAVEIGCNSFIDNVAGALGGAVFRTPNRNTQVTQIDRSTFDRNSALKAGAMYFHRTDLRITDSTISNNSAGNGGALQADETELHLTNVTLVGNRATRGLGGAIALFGNGGTLLNCTIADNRSDGGPGFFGAAIHSDQRLTIDNSIFANNTSLDPFTPMTCTRTMNGSGNIQWPRNRLAGGEPDDPCVSGIAFADPLLGPLADHGGTTLTAATSAASAIVQIGSSCPMTDQAGRPRRSPCTVGALEQ